MNAVDVFIVVMLALAALGGFRQGFVVGVAVMLGAVLALAAAKAGYAPVRGALETVVSKSTPNVQWLTVISYLAVFLVVWGAIVTLARVVRRVLRIFLLGWADRLGGALLGLLQGLVIVELLLYLGKRVPNHDLTLAVHNSTLAPTFIKVVPYLQHLFPNVPLH